MKQFKSILLIGACLCFLAGNAMALPFNNRVGNITPEDNSLQGIFNTAGIDLDYILDQNLAANWESSDSGSSSYAVHIEGGTLDGNLYVYDPGNVNNILLLFNGDDDKSYSTFAVENGKMAVQRGLGGVYSSEELAWTGTSFGFAFANDSAPATYYYTEDDKNLGVARALAYKVKEYDTAKDIKGRNLVANGNDDWVLAFDSSNYFDYNEGVFWIEDIKPVPEPATMLLLGLGLVGLAGVARKRMA